MSVNETGADCTLCGSYNCSYLCVPCVLAMLIEAGNSEDKAIHQLKNHGISIEPYELEEVRRNLHAQRT